jgi:aminobenzoyl-glutamate utilization protein B
MREHVRPTVRMHYVVQHGGDVPNVVPDYARLWVWFRDSTHQGVEVLLERARAIAEGAALATGTDVTFRVQAGDWEMLPNMAGAELLYENLTWLGPLSFTEEEHEFARSIQRATGVEPVGLKEEIEPLELDPGEPEGGSTDVADVSWAAPTIHFSVTTAAADAPWHAWPVVATGGMSIGHKGMVYAAKAMAATMVDLYEDADRLAAIQAEFREKTEGVEYVPFIPDGPPPVPTDAPLRSEG